MFFIYIDIYIYINIYTFWKKHWWTLVLSWPDELEKVGQPEKNILIRKYKNHRQIIRFCI